MLADCLGNVVPELPLALDGLPNEAFVKVTSGAVTLVSIRLFQY